MTIHEIYKTQADLRIFSGSALKIAIDQHRRCGKLHKGRLRAFYYFPENSLSAYERIEKGKEIYQRGEPNLFDSRTEVTVFTYDTYILDCLYKLSKKDDSNKVVSWFNCSPSNNCYEAEYIDLSDNVPEMFRDNSEAMQKLLFGNLV